MKTGILQLGTRQRQQSLLEVGQHVFYCTIPFLQQANNRSVYILHELRSGLEHVGIDPRCKSLLQLVEGSVDLGVRSKSLHDLKNALLEIDT